jgi:hypothetical protein
MAIFDNKLTIIQKPVTDDVSTPNGMSIMKQRRNSYFRRSMYNRIQWISLDGRKINSFLDVFINLTDHSTTTINITSSLFKRRDACSPFVDKVYQKLGVR